MKYVSLYKKFVNTKYNYDNEYLQLYNHPYTIHFDIHIHSYPAFICITDEIHHKTENIYHINNKISNLIKNNKALISKRNLIINHILVEEIYSTNHLEGMNYTKEEINNLILYYPHLDKPLSGMVNAYLNITNINDFEAIDTLQKLRDLYNKILFKDIENEDPHNLPDGELFRKETVNVVSGSNIIHTGIYPEEKIMQYMDNSLHVLNDDRLSGLIRVAIFHYLFGYIHPFYDGNGRLNRYISSYYLTQYIDNLCSLQLSIACINNQKSYYESFKITNDVRNRGDLTYFVLNFLEILESGLNDFYNSLHKYI